TNGNGFVLLSGAGMVGSISAHLGVSSGVTFGADLNITINTTTMPVNESITPESGTPLAINVPAGPYLKIDGNTALTIAGQSISGNFAFEQFTPSGSSTPVLRVAATNVTMTFGDGATTLLQLSEGEGYFLVDSTGVAGRLSVKATLTIPGVKFDGTFTLAINTTNTLVDQTFTVGTK